AASLRQFPELGGDHLDIAPPAQSRQQLKRSDYAMPQAANPNSGKAPRFRDDEEHPAVWTHARSISSRRALRSWPELSRAPHHRATHQSQFGRGACAAWLETGQKS